MSRIKRHIVFMAGWFVWTILTAIVLTLLLFRWLEAGHASPVIFLVPGSLIGHLVCGPAVLDRNRGGHRAFGIFVSGGVFFGSTTLFYVWVSSLNLYALVSGYLWLALPFIHVGISSVLLEALYRLLPAPPEQAAPGAPAMADVAAS